MSVNLWAGRAVVAEAHFDAHHNVFAQWRSRLKVERAVLWCRGVLRLGRKASAVGCSGVGTRRGAP